MVRLDSPELRTLGTELAKYEYRSTVAHLAGLLTVPGLQANAIRLETMVHLAVANCRGVRKPRLRKTCYWLNHGFQNTHIPQLEDPPEDVFVTNVVGPQGNWRIFQGIWTASDYCVQTTIDVLCGETLPKECRSLVEPVLAFLQLSELVAERTGLPRWCAERTRPKEELPHIPDVQVRAHSKAITFTRDELAKEGVPPDLLTPFVLPPDRKSELLRETLGHTSLERYPLVQAGNKVVLSLACAVSPAIRRFVTSKLRELGSLPWFSDAVARTQADQIKAKAIVGLPRPLLQLPRAIRRGNTLGLQDWLLRFDVDRYLHVVLLPDELYREDVEDLSSPLVLHEPAQKALLDYVDRVAGHCTSLSDHAEGTSLIVVGGIGHGCMLPARTLETARWGVSVIPIADFLRLFDEGENPVAAYVRCIKQKAWMQDQGIVVYNPDGDYTFYCYWRRSKFGLVPPTLPVSSESALVVGNDCTLPVRKEIRRHVDRHALQTIGGDWVSVFRLSSNSFFESDKGRPIYVSESHARVDVLAGAIATGRGPTWLLVRADRGASRSIIYEIWEGLLLLTERLVLDLERLYPQARKGPVEIKLDFSQVEFTVGDWDREAPVDCGEPEVAVNHEDRTAVIVFPRDFLRLFQRPESTGERMALESAARGIVELFEEGLSNDDGDKRQAAVDRVIGDQGIRVFHCFPAYDPVEQLQAKHRLAPSFISLEEFAFAKLQLGESTGAISAELTHITSKVECNKFLHGVVDRIWMQLKDLLTQLDRTSVLREALLVHEAILIDREHWSRTARAISALYGREEDVHSVARDRERDRIQVSLAARTVLEMAICECPESGGRQVPRAELEELLAKAILMIEVATHSDAVESDLAPPEIELLPNGGYNIEIGFNRTVMQPFLADQFRDQFDRDIEDYDELYGPEPSTAGASTGAVFPAEFTRAFEAEFGFSVDDLKAGVGEFVDLAVEDDTIVVEASLGELRGRLSRRGLTEDSIGALTRGLGIFHRPAWDVPPEGYARKDLFPWRLSRRLSVSSKPLLVTGEDPGDHLYYGVGTLRAAVLGLLRRMEQGRLPPEYFRSREMKRYVGGINDERGHAFARTVADRVSGDSWSVLTEVQMTQLGAPEELGDIDVLAWKEGKVDVIECKRLRFARTVMEVAGVFRRFRGEVGDELGKHLRRLAWIRDRPECLQGTIGFTPAAGHIDGRVVTSTRVPLSYLESLPIEPEKIGPI